MNQYIVKVLNPNQYLIEETIERGEVAGVRYFCANSLEEVIKIADTHSGGGSFTMHCALDEGEVDLTDKFNTRDNHA